MLTGICAKLGLRGSLSTHGGGAMRCFPADLQGAVYY